MSTAQSTYPERQHVRTTEVATIAGLQELWTETLGNSEICIAVLDGPVDLSHPCFEGATLSTLPTLVPSVADGGPASQHGTHVASVIFGQHHSQVKGIAPCCRGLVIPIFEDKDETSFAPCSQVDLARAISQAVEAGANVVNVSGGQFSPSGAAHPILADVVKKCADQHVLVVAAAGNQGCECLHIPGAIPSVLAVGAMNHDGDALDFSNWGYQTEGILAVGEGIRGAGVSGATTIRTGTSFATPIVSGVAGLLMSLLLKQAVNPSGHVVRNALLTTALGCEHQKVVDCARLLAGRINIGAAVELIEKGENTMAHSDPVQPSTVTPCAPETRGTNGCIASKPGVQPAECETSSSPPSLDTPSDVAPETARQPSDDPLQSNSAPSADRHAGLLEPPKSAIANDDRLQRDSSTVSPSLTPSACACGGSSEPAQLVYALGKLSFDYGTRARRAFFARDFASPPYEKDGLTNIDDPGQLLTYLTKCVSPDYTILHGNQFHSRAAVTSITWTLELDDTPIYAITPSGAFAFEIYDTIVGFLADQIKDGAERMYVPGVLGGPVTLFSGETVPMLYADIRGMFSWKTSLLIEATKKVFGGGNDGAQALADFLSRVYDDTRNLGVTSEERALNYAATDALILASIFRDVDTVERLKGLEFDTFRVAKSPICRTDADCWDITLLFYDADNLNRARRGFRFTVDVSDVIPVMIGQRKEFSVR